LQPVNSRFVSKCKLGKTNQTKKKKKNMFAEIISNEKKQESWSGVSSKCDDGIRFLSVSIGGTRLESNPSLVRKYQEARAAR